MRITSGYLSGRRIESKIPSGTRPTSDMVREAVFNTLRNLTDFDDANVLDLCSGTGAFGFEAISNGAEYVLFIEKNPKACSLIKEISNLLKIGGQNYKLINSDISKYLKNPQNFSEIVQFDIIFADPPYSSEIYKNIFEGIFNSKLLTDEGILVVEYSENYKIEIPEYFQSIKEKSYGTTNVIFMQLN